MLQQTHATDDMERYMHYLVHDTDKVLSECRKLFVQRFPGQERYWDSQIGEWLD